MMQCVGTSDVKVMRSRASSASSASASKLRRSSTVMVAPSIVKVSRKYSELAWHSGITSRPWSSRVRPNSSAVTSAGSALPSWLRGEPAAAPAG
jgi:hypothetical protein